MTGMTNIRIIPQQRDIMPTLLLPLRHPAVDVRRAPDLQEDGMFLLGVRTEMVAASLGRISLEQLLLGRAAARGGVAVVEDGGCDVGVWSVEGGDGG